MKNTQIINEVERAISELRRGEPVLLEEEGKSHILFAAEGITEHKLRDLSNPNIVISGYRAIALNIPNAANDAYYSYPLSSEEDWSALSGIAGLEKIECSANNFSEERNAPQSAFLLLQHAELLPTAILSEAIKTEDVLKVSSEAITAYEKIADQSLEEVCRAPLILHNIAGMACEIIGFRASTGGKEHYAIVVGDGLKQKEPLIRVHSSCYTGDLLHSLECDCRDQLHTALHKMAEQGGGIVLYLMQEGRGIGLVNKLRAYALKAKGLDTVEANHTLGLADDDRPFTAAARMLNKLNKDSVKLLTNNPRKVKALEACGINVSERVPHKIEETEHTHAYFEAKRHKLGHVMND